MIRDYEAVLIVSSDLNEEGISKVQAQFKDVIERHQGQMLEMLTLGKRKLSYRIKKQTEGVYLQVRLKMPPQEVGNLEKAVVLIESVIRLMIVQGGQLSGAINLSAEKNEPATELRASASEEV